MEKFIAILRYLPVVESVPYLLFYYGASVVRMLKTKSSNDVSIIGWAVATTVQVCYISYGLFIVKEWQYIASCFCATIGTAAVLVTALYYRHRGYQHVETQKRQ